MVCPGMRKSLMTNEFDPYISQENAERGAQVIQIDSSKHVAAVAICAAICGISAAIAIWAGYQTQVMTTEYRVQLNHTMHLEAEQDALKNRVAIVERNHAIER